MSVTLRTILIVIAAGLLTLAAVTACGWIDGPNVAALVIGAAAAWMVAQLP